MRSSSLRGDNTTSAPASDREELSGATLWSLELMDTWAQPSGKRDRAVENGLCDSGDFP